MSFFISLEPLPSVITARSISSENLSMILYALESEVPPLKMAIS